MSLSPSKQVLTCKSMSCALRASLDSYEHVSSVSWLRRDPFELVHALTWSCALYLCAAGSNYGYCCSSSFAFQTEWVLAFVLVSVSFRVCCKTQGLDCYMYDVKVYAENMCVCVLVASVRVFMGALGGGDPPPLLLSA